MLILATPTIPTAAAAAAATAYSSEYYITPVNSAIDHTIPTQTAHLLAQSVSAIPGVYEVCREQGTPYTVNVSFLSECSWER